MSSIGLRPWTVYGVGRDFGMTSEPTKAILALALGRPYHITYGGKQDLQYVDDVAKTFLRCLVAPYHGAKSYNLAAKSSICRDSMKPCAPSNRPPHTSSPLERARFRSPTIWMTVPYSAILVPCPGPRLKKVSARHWSTFANSLPKGGSIRTNSQAPMTKERRMPNNQFEGGIFRFML